MRKFLWALCAMAFIAAGASAETRFWPSGTLLLSGSGYNSGANNFLSIAADGSGVDSGFSQASMTAGVTDGSSAAAGKIGEVISAVCPNSSTAPAIFTNGSPTIAVATTPPIGCPVNFTTSGGLPTNFVVGTNYYVISAGYSAGVSFEVAALPGGTPAISAGSAGSGVQTTVFNAKMTSTNTVPIMGVSLTAGDWSCNGVESWIPAASTTSSLQKLTITQTSNDAGTAGANGNFVMAAAFTASIAMTLPIGSVRELISATTEIYLNSTPTFAASTAAADGQLTCRRVR